MSRLVLAERSVLCIASEKVSVGTYKSFHLLLEKVLVE